MHTQIYTAQSVEEALALVEAGADIVGITPSPRPLPGIVTEELAAQIVEAIGSSALTSAISVEEDEDDIVRMVSVVKPDILHLCGDITKVDPEMVGRIRARIGDVKIDQAIPMTGPEAVDAALAFAPVVDYLLLDSYSPEIGGVGAAGFTHDWSISRKIVESVDVPVILAGGLSAENVAEAIATVQPWGVDSLTRTNAYREDGTFRKDLDKVRAFIAAAHGAASN
ncbi:MAG: phosphoribosylanthranilate isomerase [Homoserinimonas sp.]|nr:phosphoribosylanthranilate isomerase [Homoserinimonas sp.]MCW5945127.1 phosphoribosylanthranilate isomerase [Cryobacterium sp.]